MTAKREELIEELHAETDSLVELLNNLSADDFATQTPAPGWNIADQLAHLTFYDRAATQAILDPASFASWLARSLNDRSSLDDGQDLVAALAPAELVRQFLEARGAYVAAARSFPNARIAWFGPPLSTNSMTTARLMETFAHGADIRDALGEPIMFFERHLEVVFLGYKTIGFSFRNRGLEPPQGDIEILVSMSDGSTRSFGSASIDPEGRMNRVAGSLGDIAMLVVQRRNLADLDISVSGSDARRWVEIAQAYAGPPGGGRPPQAADPASL